MDSDDRPIGRVLSRREALAALGLAGASLLVGEACGRGENGNRALAQGTGSLNCIVRPEQTEGPYFVDERLNRADIRSDPTNRAIKAGAPLALAMFVSRLAGSSCSPLANAVVDVWQCDADGVYSDVRDPQFDTTGQKYLRGYQLTNKDGVARFTTIVPGWYRSRTVHIHFKIRSSLDSPAQEFTSQLYFDDAFIDEVHSRVPYAQEGRRTRNEQDGIFRRGGSELMLAPVQSDAGYAADFRIGLQLA